MKKTKLMLVMSICTLMLVACGNKTLVDVVDKMARADFEILDTIYSISAIDMVEEDVYHNYEFYENQYDNHIFVVNESISGDYFTAYYYYHEELLEVNSCVVDTTNFTDSELGDYYCDDIDIDIAREIVNNTNKSLKSAKLKIEDLKNLSYDF